jgi:type IV fimbrial biogenesis protein FimT
MKQHRKPGGFTLPEMLITMGIVAIVLSTAVPSISSTIKDNRLVTQLNSVITDIHFARSEAVKRDTRVILCRSAVPTAGSPVCGGTTRDWSSGYLIFADDGNYNNNVYNAGTDTLLRIGLPAVSGTRVRTSWSWNNNLEFNPDGSTNESGAVAMMSICDDRGKTDGRQIRVAPNGIPQMFAKDISTCYPE